MREIQRDKERLNHILEAIENIFEFTIGLDLNDFAKNKMLRFAVIKNFEIIGEAANSLTTEFRSTHKKIDWRIIIGLRNVLVHGYYQINEEIIWKTIINDLPTLKDNISKIISGMDKNQDYNHS